MQTNSRPTIRRNQLKVHTFLSSISSESSRPRASLTSTPSPDPLQPSQHRLPDPKKLHDRSRIPSIPSSPTFTKAYTKIENESFSIGGKTYGILIDYANDSVSFVSSGNDVGAAFGAESLLFSESETKDQM
jgi:hypothetical protein